MLCIMLTIYRNLAVKTWTMTKYSKIHYCNKQIHSCNILFLNTVELHFTRSKFVYLIQVNILFDLFALMLCQYMCHLFNTKTLFPYNMLGYSLL